MSFAELFDEPQHLHGPDAQRCSASDHPEAWAALTTGWSQFVEAVESDD
ncbi:Uncharacterised protein [Mycobacteroides abscessus subsp. abscessus]|nr:Uncharacterised protein [Mycobacteroides abscessus subsp. abscessus]